MELQNADQPVSPTPNVPGAAPAEDDRQRRIDALRRLASENAQEQPASAAESGQIAAPANSPATRVSLAPPASQRWWRTWVAVIAALLALVVIGVGVLAGLPQRLLSSGGATSGPPAAIPNTLTLDLQKYSLNCPIQAAWSPDTLSVAVTLSRQGCAINPGAPEAPQIAIFDARTGALKHTFDTQSVVAGNSAALSSGAILWSRDGRQVIFDATTMDSQGELHPTLALFPLDGAKPRVLRGAAVTADARIASAIWDMSAGKAKVFTAPLTSALSYQWGAHGAITVAQAAPSQTQAQSYSGSPMLTPGSQTIPLWQPGVIFPLQGFDENGNPSGFLPPPAYAFAASAYVWSPDGRYLSAPLQLVGRLPALPDMHAPQVTPNSCDTQLDPGVPDLATACAHAAAPFADRALEAIVRASDVPQTVPGQPPTQQYLQAPVPVVWRPDGKLLATILPGTGFSMFTTTPTTIKVSLYDTTTGSQIATLSVQHTPETDGAPAPNNVTSILSWSPTGKQLAFVDYNTNRVVIWGAKLLPA